MKKFVKVVTVYGILTATAFFAFGVFLDNLSGIAPVARRLSALTDLSELLKHLDLQVWLRGSL